MTRQHKGACQPAWGGGRGRAVRAQQAPPLHAGRAEAARSLATVAATPTSAPSPRRLFPPAVPKSPPSPRRVPRPGSSSPRGSLSPAQPAPRPPGSGEVVSKTLWGPAEEVRPPSVPDPELPGRACPPPSLALAGHTHLSSAEARADTLRDRLQTVPREGPVTEAVAARAGGRHTSTPGERGGRGRGSRGGGGAPGGGGGASPQPALPLAGLSPASGPSWRTPMRLP